MFAENGVIEVGALFNCQMSLNLAATVHKDVLKSFQVTEYLYFETLRMSEPFNIT